MSATGSMKDRDISPPPSKRRKLSNPEATTPALPQTSITVYSWNVNGIAPFIQPSITSFFQNKNGEATGQNVAKASLRDFLRRHHWPTVLFLQEVKINPEDATTIHAVEKAVRKSKTEEEASYDYHAHFCLPSDKHNARGFGRKVYGVCSIVRKDFMDSHVDRIRKVDWDVEGRVLVIETKPCERMPKLALINIYAVNGTDNRYNDPNTGEVTGTRHDRKLQFHTLLQAECRALDAEGFAVIVGGDMNIARAPADGYPNLRTFPEQHCINRLDFEQKFFSHSEKGRSSGKDVAEKDPDAGLGMIDTFRHLHPDQKSYTYYPRTKSFGESCDRVDMILISHSLREHLRQAGMHETPSERGPSDHVPLYAQLTFEEATIGS